MNFFALPHAHPMTFKKLDYYEEIGPPPGLAPPPGLDPPPGLVPPPGQHNSLQQYLYEIKEKIQQFDKDWDTYKEYTNPYEYIHTIVPHMKSAVATYRPLSRSYFKMVELIHHFKMMDMCLPNAPIRTFHLAEGPGGFIEAFANERKIHAPVGSLQDVYYGMTLIDETDRSIPSWKKSQLFLRNHPQVRIEVGADGTGNLLSIHNMTDCVQRFGSSIDFLTADGGFDFSEDFNKQEQKILPLLFAQIAYAVCLQKRGGVFVLKMFDCFSPASMDLMYLLSSLYEKVYITKPQTSRYANSERYIVCLNFLFDNSTPFYSYFLATFAKMLANGNQSVCRFLHERMPMYYINRLHEANVVIGMNQIENIYATLGLMENKQTKKARIEHLIKVNLNKCVYWCLQYVVSVLPALMPKTI
jgi:23S rRNA U2552 (ribose-2'-O)-methylase RlmE/FtsJ